MATIVRVCLIVAALLVWSSGARAEGGSPSFDLKTAPQVTKASGSRSDGSAGLGNRVTLSVHNFSELFGQVSNNCQSLVLFLGGIPIPGMPPESCDPYEGNVTFLLDRNSQHSGNDGAWHALLGSPSGFSRPVTASIGPNDQFAVPTLVRTFSLFVIPKQALIIYFIATTASLALLVFLCLRTAIIRAPGAQPSGGPRPYSLSRFQMAFWFFIVASGYVFCWMVTGELDTITESVLVLIGIGSGTAVSAAVIDADGAPAQDSHAAPSPAQPLPPAKSRGFVADILSDGSGGVSIHRFQMVGWTLILGVIFCVRVYHRLAMPDFSATLLGLMGISSSTYVLFKFPEKRKREAQAQQIAAADQPARADGQRSVAGDAPPSQPRKD